MIKAIIFDYFGVIYSDDYWRFVREDKNMSGSFHELSNKVNLGTISWKEFVETVASKTGKQAEEVHELYKSERIDPRMVSYVAGLHKSYKTALLTNAHYQFLEPVIKEARLDHVFDVVVLSSRVGIIKPNPRIFDYTLDKLGVASDEVVFIDDIMRNVEAAREQGIKSLLYTDFDSMKRELKSLLLASSAG